MLEQVIIVRQGNIDDVNVLNLHLALDFKIKQTIVLAEGTVDEEGNILKAGEVHYVVCCESKS